MVLNRTFTTDVQLTERCLLGYIIQFVINY